MKSATARRILACHVDDPNGDIPPLMQSALKALANEPELQADYDEQSRIDSSLRSAFKDAEVPQEALTIFAAQVEAIPRPHFNPRDPAMISVIIGFVLLVFVLTWNFLGRPAAFPSDGLEVAEAILEVDESTIQPVTVSAEELDDWFVLKGFDGFRTPSFLLRERVDSAGLTVFEGQPVAIVGLPALKAQLVVFAAAPLDIVIPDGEWRTAQVNHEFAAAMTRDGDICFLVIVRGTEGDAGRIVKNKSR